MLSRVVPATLLISLLLTTGCSPEESPSLKSLKTRPKPIISKDPPDPTQANYRVRFETSKGDFFVDVYHDWSPLGADRFIELVKIGYYDECRFFRVLKGGIAQVGMNGDPVVNALWSEKRILDEPVIRSNQRGYITFAHSGPNSRTTHLFINYGNNSLYDRPGHDFSPFGYVVKGMDVVDKFFSGYGDTPDQGRIKSGGNKYLNHHFPKLDYIKRATIVTKPRDIPPKKKTESPKTD